MATLNYKSCSIAPGYRDLTLVLVNPATGKEHELRLAPKDVQSLIFDCASAATQKGDHPPLDWDAYRAQIFWPTITPWRIGPAQPTVALSLPDAPPKEDR